MRIWPPAPLQSQLCRYLSQRSMYEYLAVSRFDDVEVSRISTSGVTITTWTSRPWVALARDVRRERQQSEVQLQSDSNTHTLVRRSKAQMFARESMGFRIKCEGCPFATISCATHGISRCVYEKSVLSYSMLSELPSTYLLIYSCTHVLF